MNSGPIYASDTVFERLLRQRVTEACQQQQEFAAAGNSADWGAYRQQVGRIAAYREVIAAMDDIAKKMRGGQDREET